MSDTKKSHNTAPPTKIQKELLSEIVEATNSPTGFTYVSEAKAKPLVDRGLIELNTGMTNDEGHMAARATNEGISIIMGNTESNTGTENSTAFTVQSGPIPGVVQGRRLRPAIYPFAVLNVGEWFHVPVSEERPNPAKAMASTVSSANKRYAVEIPGETRVDRKGNIVPATKQERKFSLLRVDASHPEGAGAVVTRVE